MNLYKIIVTPAISLMFIISGGSSYQIPLQTCNHPASSDVPIVQVELSPILNLAQGDYLENQEDYDEIHH